MSRASCYLFIAEGKNINLELRTQDREFHYLISGHDVLQNRNRLHEHALRRFPETPLSEFIILVDCTEVPPKCTVAPFAEYDSRGISDSVYAEAHNDMLLNKFRHDPDISLVESRIPSGTEVIFVTTIFRQRMLS